MYSEHMVNVAAQTIQKQLMLANLLTGKTGQLVANHHFFQIS